MEAQLNDIRDNVSVGVINQTKDIILDCAKNIKSNDSTFNISTLPSLSDTLTNLADKYVDSLKSIVACQKAYLSLSKKIEEEEEEARTNGGVYPEVTDFPATFKKTVTAEKKKLTNYNKQIKSELSKIVRPPEEADEEIRVEAPTRQIPKDPITKADIKFAVRSTVCNHIFDQEGIENYFVQKETAKKTRVQCPLAGCTNKNMKRSELVPDDETNELIQSLCELPQS